MYAFLIWGCRPGGLVDYEDDEDDEDYKPPPRKQSDNSGEDEEGVVESFLKRKSTSKEESEPKRLQQRSPKMSKPNEGVFAALCSTLSHTVLPSKKTSGTEPEAPRSDMSKHNNEVNNEGKGHTTSNDAGRSADEDDHSEKGKESSGSPQQESEDLHDCPNNGPIGDDCPLISPKSSPEMAVNGS